MGILIEKRTEEREIPKVVNNPNYFMSNVPSESPTKFTICSNTQFPFEPNIKDKIGKIGEEQKFYNVSLCKTIEFAQEEEQKKTSLLVIDNSGSLTPKERELTQELVREKLSTLAPGTDVKIYVLGLDKDGKTHDVSNYENGVLLIEGTTDSPDVYSQITSALSKKGGSTAIWQTLQRAIETGIKFKNEGRAVELNVITDALADDKSAKTNVDELGPVEEKSFISQYSSKMRECGLHLNITVVRNNVTNLGNALNSFQESLSRLAQESNGVFSTNTFGGLRNQVYVESDNKGDLKVSPISKQQYNDANDEDSSGGTVRVGQNGIYVTLENTKKQESEIKSIELTCRYSTKIVPPGTQKANGWAAFDMSASTATWHKDLLAAKDEIMKNSLVQAESAPIQSRSQDYDDVRNAILNFVLKTKDSFSFYRGGHFTIYTDGGHENLFDRPYEHYSQDVWKSKGGFEAWRDAQLDKINSSIKDAVKTLVKNEIAIQFVDCSNEQWKEKDWPVYNTQLSLIAELTGGRTIKAEDLKYENVISYQNEINKDSWIGGQAELKNPCATAKIYYKNGTSEVKNLALDLQLFKNQNNFNYGNRETFASDYLRGNIQTSNGITRFQNDDGGNTYILPAEQKSNVLLVRVENQKISLKNPFEVNSSKFVSNTLAKAYLGFGLSESQFYTIVVGPNKDNKGVDQLRKEITERLPGVYVKYKQITFGEIRKNILEMISNGEFGDSDAQRIAKYLSGKTQGKFNSSYFEYDSGVKKVVARTPDYDQDLMSVTTALQLTKLLGEIPDQILISFPNLDRKDADNPINSVLNRMGADQIRIVPVLNPVSVENGNVVLTFNKDADAEQVDMIKNDLLKNGVTLVDSDGIERKLKVVELNGGILHVEQTLKSISNMFGGGGFAIKIGNDMVASCVAARKTDIEGMGLQNTLP